MLIRCPNCHFDREINTSQIPANAVVATCPRCKTRFRFRWLPSEQAHSSENFPNRRFFEEQNNQEDQYLEDDPLPPGAKAIRHETRPPRYEQPQQNISETPHTQQKHFKSPVNNNEDEEEETPVTRPAPPEPEEEKKQKYRQNQQEEMPDPKKERKWEATRKRTDIPWECPNHYNPFSALYQTIVRVMFSAPSFFSTIPAFRGGGIGRPLFFYVLLGFFQTLMDRLWFTLSLQAVTSMNDPSVQDVFGSMTQNTSLPLAIVLSPFMLILQLFFFAGVFFLMVRLVQPDRADFPVILRVIAYSAAPTILCVVPLVGPIIASVWFAVVCLAGCHYALNLPWSRTLLALGPLYAIFFAISLQAARHLLGGA